MIVLFTLRCRSCHSDRMNGSEADGWTCADCGSTGVRFYKPRVEVPMVVATPRPSVGPKPRRRSRKRQVV